MVPIITTTYHKNEKYCDCLVDLLDQMWPGHPPIWFITDRGNIKYRQTICVDSTNWVYILHEGLKQVKKVSGLIRYVYFIIEDHFPLWPCNLKEITKIQNLTLSHNLDCVSFVTYDMYQIIESNWGQGDNFVEIDGEKLFKVPGWFSFPNQIQPAIWKADHLMAVCALALEKGITESWGFERLPSTADHYVAEYSWPTVHGGFLVRRYVNFPAIKKIKMPEGRRLAGMLLKDFICELFHRIKKRFFKLFKPSPGKDEIA